MILTKTHSPFLTHFVRNDVAFVWLSATIFHTYLWPRIRIAENTTACYTTVDSIIVRSCLNVHHTSVIYIWKWCVLSFSKATDVLKRVKSCQWTQVYFVIYKYFIRQVDSRKLDINKICNAINKICNRRHDIHNVHRNLNTLQNYGRIVQP